MIRTLRYWLALGWWWTQVPVIGDYLSIPVNREAARLAFKRDTAAWLARKPVR